jgi:hypothetical protein
MKKFFIWLLGFLFVLFVVLRGVPFLINNYLNANADRIVTNLITRASLFGDHQVTFGQILLDYDYFGTYLKIRDIKVKPSKELDEEHIRMDLTIDQLDLTGFKWSEYLLRNSISVDSALISKMVIISSTPPLVSLQQRPSRPKKGKSKDYESLSVKYFDLNDLSIELVNSLYDSVRISLQDMDLKVQGFRLTKDDIQDPNSLFHVDKVKGRIGEAVFHFDQFRQYALVKDIILDTHTQRMFFGYMGLLNKQGKYQYTSQFEERQSWTEIDNAKLDLRGVHFGSFFRKGIIEVDSVFASDMRVEIFVDKRKVEDRQKRPQMVHQLFKDLGQVIHIDHIFVNNAYLKIEERPDNKSPRSGFLYFSDMQVHIINFSNFVERRGENKLLKLEASGKLMGQGMLKALAQYELESEKGDFTLKGSLGPMELKALDPMIEPQSQATVKSGKLNSLVFDIKGNDYDGTGQLTVLYENLELALLNPNFERDNNFFRKVGSFLANTLIIKSNNPKKNGETVAGTVYYIRDTHKSMFAYWWKLIFSGLKSTLTGDDLEELKKKEQIRLAETTNSSKTLVSQKSDVSKTASEHEKSSHKERREERRQNKKTD